MFWTEYGDSLAHTKYPSDIRSMHRFNPVICLKLCHRTIHFLLFIAFAVALTFIMLFIFDLIIRPSLFIRFSSPLQRHFEHFSERVSRINICDASFNHKMSPLTSLRSVIRRVMLIASGSPVAAVKVWTSSLGIASSCQRGIGERERSETMTGRNGVWTLIGKIHRESVMRRWKTLFHECYWHDVIIMMAVSWCCQWRRSPQCGCRIKIFIMWGTILNWLNIPGISYYIKFSKHY